ncbi:hypothetical protein SAMN05421881_107310 [Nitrosomonas halophila]|uniref:Uncharacterized protein n=1 Tax=Nitrosomonas halophila TaxID=44576 RepID=A0A1H3NI42_9PROT|nr:hypothetical protein SAMN05421881_107310 [Nitrosomonas halophila]
MHAICHADLFAAFGGEKRYDGQRNRLGYDGVSRRLSENGLIY